MVQLKRKHNSAFKGQVALEALKEQQTLGQVANQFQIHPTQVRKWRDLLKEKLPIIFGESDNALKQLIAKDQLIDRLYRQVGQVTTELDWLKKKMGLTPD